MCNTPGRAIESTDPRRTGDPREETVDVSKGIHAVGGRLAIVDTADVGEPLCKPVKYEDEHLLNQAGLHSPPAIKHPSLTTDQPPLLPLHPHSVAEKPHFPKDVQGKQKGELPDLSSPAHVQREPLETIHHRMDKEAPNHHHLTNLLFHDESAEGDSEQRRGNSSQEGSTTRPGLHVEVDDTRWHIPEDVKKIIHSPHSPQHFQHIIEGRHLDRPPTTHHTAELSKALSSYDHTSAFESGGENLGRSEEMGRGIRGRRIGRAPLLL